MATKPTNQLRQIYDVRGGAIDIKIVTESGLSVEEIEAFEGVIEVVERYVDACPPEPAEVRAERLAAQARAEEFQG
ncbi:MAG TPA: hypothetical protein VF245_00945 [Solirubrobacterales bacterium]